MVDWSLAHQVARMAAGGDAGAGDSGAEVKALVAEMEGSVAGYTRLEPAGPIPSPEVLSRHEWADMNIDALSRLLDPVAGRLDTRLSFAGPLAGALRACAGATVAAEAGLVMGYVAQRVLGQYELSLLQPAVPARLVFVGPNLERAVREMGVDREAFLGWIAIHELTHRLQFQGVPWLRERLDELVPEYLATVDVRIESGAAGGLPSLPDVRRLAEAFREGGLMALVQTGRQRKLMSKMQALMAVIEGYSEHVMDAVGEKSLVGYDGLREAMERRRGSRSAPERVLERLLGLDFKMRQYELGRAFSDAVVKRQGIDGLNRVWDSPEYVPTLRELERPALWLERMARAAPAAA